MASQKWIVFFAFLMLFIFMEEATIFPACKEEVIKQLKESITALENCNCSGKSTNSPVKVKQRRDEQRCFQQICIEMVFFRYKYSLHLFAKRYFSTTPLVKILDYVRHTSRRTIKYQQSHPKLIPAQRPRIESVTKETVPSLV